MKHFDNGWIKEAVDPHGITTTYDYNDLGQQSARTLTAAGGDSSRTMTWSYHPDGKQASMADDGVPVGRNVTLVDNSDRQHTTATGTWETSSVAGEQGLDHATHAAVPDDSENPGDGECDPAVEDCEIDDPQDPENTDAPDQEEPASFTWRLDVPADGTYDVYVSYPQVPAAATDAQYTLVHGDPDAEEGSGQAEVEEEPVIVDQTQSAGAWQQVGSYELTKGERTRLELAVSATGVVVADAVKIVRDNSQDTDAQQKTFTYRYDANGNLTTIEDDNADAIVDSYAMAYDQLNQVASVTENVTSGSPVTTSYDYNVNAQPVEVTHPDQHATYAYDLRNLVETVTTTDTAGETPGEAATTSYTHDARGLTATQTKGNGNVVSYGYNPDGALASMRETKGGPTGSLVAEHAYTYDRNGNQTSDEASKQDADNPGSFLDSTSEYAYDPVNRLLEKVKTGNGASTESYVYDANANIIEQIVAGETASYEYDRNRLQSATTGEETASYTYDPYGRQVSTRVAGRVAQRTAYDGFDHVVRSESRNENGVLEATTYEYDPLDRTANSTTGGTTTNFTYLGMSSEVLTEEVAGQLAKSYQYSPWGHRLSQVTHPGADGDDQPEGTVYYGYNAHTDVETLTDQSGDAVATYGYTAYGNNDLSEFHRHRQARGGGPWGAGVVVQRLPVQLQALAGWLEYVRHGVP